MTVKELIEELGKQQPNDEVILVYNVNEGSRQWTRIVTYKKRLNNTVNQNGKVELLAE